MLAAYDGIYHFYWSPVFYSFYVFGVLFNVYDMKLNVIYYYYSTITWKKILYRAGFDPVTSCSPVLNNSIVPLKHDLTIAYCKYKVYV